MYIHVFLQLQFLTNSSSSIHSVYWLTSILLNNHYVVHIGQYGQGEIKAIHILIIIMMCIISRKVKYRLPLAPTNKLYETYIDTNI